MYPAIQSQYSIRKNQNKQNSIGNAMNSRQARCAFFLVFYPLCSHWQGAEYAESENYPCKMSMASRDMSFAKNGVGRIKPRPPSSHKNHGNCAAMHMWSPGEYNFFLQNGHFNTFPPPPHGIDTQKHCKSWIIGCSTRRKVSIYSCLDMNHDEKYLTSKTKTGIIPDLPH